MFFRLLFSIIWIFLLLNSHILSGSEPIIVYRPLILLFSTDSNIKLFFFIKKLLIIFSIILLFLHLVLQNIIWFFLFWCLFLKSCKLLLIFINCKNFLLYLRFGNLYLFYIFYRCNSHMYYTIHWLFDFWTN